LEFLHNFYDSFTLFTILFKFQKIPLKVISRTIKKRSIYIALFNK